MRIYRKEVALDLIVARGFDRGNASRALEAANGNHETAIKMLMSKNKEFTPTAMVHGLTSQQSVTSGRAASTCIALAGATDFLRQHQNSPALLVASLPDLIDAMVTQGADSHQSLQQQKACGGVDGEDEVLQQKSIFPLRLVGGVRRGIMSNDPSHPLTLHMGLLLELCRSEAAIRGSSSPWTAILVSTNEGSAPAETVLVCLPTAARQKRSCYYVLLDSCPRKEFRVKQAYARIHPTLDDLVRTLVTIFFSETDDLTTKKSYAMYPLTLDDKPETLSVMPRQTRNYKKCREKDHKKTKEATTEGADKENKDKNGTVQWLASAGTGVVTGTGAVFQGIPAAAASLGFASSGVTGGSLAASIMSTEAVLSGGGVAAGGVTATLQSVGTSGVFAAFGATGVGLLVLGTAAVVTVATKAALSAASKSKEASGEKKKEEVAPECQPKCDG